MDKYLYIFRYLRQLVLRLPELCVPVGMIPAPLGLWCEFAQPSLAPARGMNSVAPTAVSSKQVFCFTNETTSSCRYARSLVSAHALVCLIVCPSFHSNKCAWMRGNISVEKHFNPFTHATDLFGPFFTQGSNSNCLHTQHWRLTGLLP
jgi:hypothetical protein